MKTKTISEDTRTPAKKAADERAANIDWSGPEVVELLTEDGARELIRHRKRLEELYASNPALASESLRSQPLRWKTRVYRINRCEYSDGTAVVQVSPHDEELVAEIKRRVEGNRFHHLDYCQCSAFICFPEDYERFKD